MNREKQLAKNTIIIAIGQICTKFISFFLLPLYTTYLSTKEFGIVDLLNTYIYLLIPILFFQIDQGVFRFLIDTRENNNEKRKIISTSLITILLQCFIYVLLFMVFSKFINNEYKYFLLSNVIVSMILFYFLQVSRGLGDNITYSVCSVMAGLGNILLNIILIATFKFGANGMLLASLLSNFLGIVYIFTKLKIYKFISMKFLEKHMLIKLWKYSLPLVPNQLSWWIINASDRTIITAVLGIGVNGIYAAANKFSSLIITIFTIFNLTWTEQASLTINDKDNSQFFSKIFNLTLRLFISLCIILIIALPFLFKYIITNKAYINSYYQIPILLIAMIFNIIVSLIGSIYVALKKSKEIAKTSVYAAIINITINICLVKLIGLYAASISTLVSYLSMAIYRYIDIQKYVKLKLDLKNEIILFLLLVYSIMSYYFNNFNLNLINLLLIILILLYNKKNIIYILTNIKNIIKKWRVSN